MRRCSLTKAEVKAVFLVGNLEGNYQVWRDVHLIDEIAETNNVF